MAASRPVLRVLCYLAAAAAVVVGPAIAPTGPAADTVRTVGAPCVNGVVPLNPNIVNCNLPKRPKRTPGQAPDAGALIACKGVPQCISYYVNYPGQTIWDSGLWSPDNQ